MKFCALIILMMAGITLPLLSSAQYFRSLLDYQNHSGDFATNIALITDSSYLIYGSGISSVTHTEQLEWMAVNKDASSVLTRHSFSDTSNRVNYFAQAPYSIVSCLGGGYTNIFAKEILNPSGIVRQAIGMIRLNGQLDTLSTTTYTDTSNYWEFPYSCMQLSDKSYFIAGGSEQNTDTEETQTCALLIRTDSFGNMLWSKRYKQNPTFGSGFQSILQVTDSTVLIGGYTEGVDQANGIYIKYPWLVKMDTAGNILYQNILFQYRGGGAIAKDPNGGYLQWGNTNQPVNNDPLSFWSFPAYLAHLDDNLIVQWDKVFYDSIPAPYHIDMGNVKQLHDGSYLALGGFHGSNTHTNQSWVAKINNAGSLLWEQILMVDTGRDDSYLFDAVERADHSIVLAGMGFSRDPNDPQYYDQDFWIVGLDSNGCPQPGCAPTGVHNITAAASQDVIIYPNPSNGTFTIRTSSQKGTLIQITNALGQVVYNERASFIQGEAAMHLNVQAGMYIMQLNDAAGSKVIKPLIIYK